jgi:hypothetical protein
MKLLINPTKSKTNESKGFVFVNSLCCCCKMSVNIDDINDMITNKSAAMIPPIAKPIKILATSCRPERLFGSSKTLLLEFDTSTCPNGTGHSFIDGIRNNKNVKLTYLQLIFFIDFFSNFICFSFSVDKEIIYPDLLFENKY